MHKVIGKFLLILLSVFCFCDCCLAEEGGSDYLVSPELLKAGNLKIVWENKLPILKKERLERLLIVGNRIYGLSDRNYLVSLDREKGTVVFSRSLAQAGIPVIGLELYKNELFSVVGNGLVEMEPITGGEIKRSEVGFHVICPAARNEKYFYFGGGDKRMHAMRAGDLVQMFEVSADDDTMVTSIVADDNFVIFSTEGGGLYSILPNLPKKIWYFKAGGGIVGPVVRDGQSLFFASRDKSVYRVNVDTGELEWKYLADGELEKSPRVTGEVVYQYVSGRGLAAIGKKSGKLMWQVSGGVELLAEWNERAYVMTEARKLVVMDNKMKKELYSMNFARVSRYTANVEDSKIYIGDEAGRILCLEPIE